MNIDVHFTGGIGLSEETACHSVAVIDILRATTTIAAALTAGATAVYPVAGVDEARAVAEEVSSAVLGGERGGMPLPGFAAGNSPLEYTPECVRGRAVVLTTTNGTQALNRVVAARAAHVAAAAFVNAAVTARWHVALGKDVTIVCAGTDGRFSLEDAAGAGCLVAHIAELAPRARLSDAARAAYTLWDTYATDIPGLFAAALHGRRLANLGFGSDLQYCARLNELSVVPVWNGRALVAAT